MSPEEEEEASEANERLRSEDDRAEAKVIRVEDDAADGDPEKVEEAAARVEKVGEASTEEIRAARAGAATTGKTRLNMVFGSRAFFGRRQKEGGVSE